MPDNPPRAIAVWNTAFLGDAVLTLPLLQVLAVTFPFAAIDFYVRKGLAPLFSAQPQVRTVYEFAKGGQHWNLGSDMPTTGRRLAERHYDAWISAHTSTRSALLARLSHAPVRIGYAGGLAPKLCYTHLVERCFYELHEVERLLQLATPLLQKYGLSAQSPPFFSDKFLPSALVLPATAEAVAETFWQGLFPQSAPCLGLHPGSVWGTKRWTPAGFALVTRRAVDAGAHVLVFAGRGEESMAEEVIARAGVRGHPLLHDLSGRLSLPELAAFVGRLDCYVSNDSGPLHLAWMQGTPVTALFGPTVRKLGFFPRGPKATVFEVPLPCRPCSLHGPQSCPLGHHACMVEIDANAVWLDVEEKLFA